MCVTTQLTDVDYVKTVEDLGFDWAWVPDSQLIWSDCYAYLAMAAERTSTLKLATGVAVAGIRSAPVTAHSIASVNALAPGRVALGIGSGNSAYRLMNHKPLPIKKFGDELRVIRALLAGEEVEFTFRGKTAPIKLMMPDRGFIDITEPIPIYVSGFGPRSQALAGEYGDGLVVSLPPQERTVLRSLTTVENAAVAAGRDFDADTFPIINLINIIITQPGESVTSDRIIEQHGPWAVSSLHYLFDTVRQYDREPPRHLADIWDRYSDLLARTPEHIRHMRIHEGHCTYLLAEEREFITEDLMRTTAIVGSPDEVIEQLRELEAAGMDQIMCLPAQGTHYEYASEISSQIIERY